MTNQIILVTFKLVVSIENSSKAGLMTDINCSDSISDRKNHTMKYSHEL